MQRTVIAFGLAVATLFAGQLFAAFPSTETDHVINGYEVILVIHELLFVFWLGPDVGVYIWSRKAAQPGLTVEQRLTAARMMHTIDLMPRICMSLMLTAGGILTEAVGIEHPWWQMVGIILLGPVWLTMVLIAYFKEGTELGETVARLDYWFRWGLILAMLVSVTYSTVTGRLDAAPWVTGKLIIFAALILFGLLMRRQMRPFIAGLKQLKSEGPSESVDLVMISSLARARPFVMAIWIGLILEAVLGIVQPGSEPAVAADTATVEIETERAP